MLLPLQTWEIAAAVVVLSFGFLVLLYGLIDKFRRRRLWNGPGLDSADIDPAWERQAPQHADDPIGPPFATGSLSNRAPPRDK